MLNSSEYSVCSGQYKIVIHEDTGCGYSVSPRNFTLGGKLMDILAKITWVIKKPRVSII